MRYHFNLVMDEIRWERGLSPWNHTPHYPFVATHTADAMPLASLGGPLSDVLWNLKYTSYCWKVLVALNWLGNICWVCLLSPGTTPDILIWDAQGPQRSAGDFVNFEVGIHDGAFKGRVGSIIPFVGGGKLSDGQQEYNDVHGVVQGKGRTLLCPSVALACVSRRLDTSRPHSAAEDCPCAVTHNTILFESQADIPALWTMDPLP